MTMPPVDADLIKFALYLLFGWVIVALQAKKNFDLPTYDIATNDPASLMLPRLISSQNLYLRGFLTYFAGITVLYLTLCIAGPSFILPIVEAFGKVSVGQSGLEAPAIGSFELPPQANVGDAPVEFQLPEPAWIIGVALAMIGLGSNVAFVRQPELVLRRFSHRIAWIPNYVKYLASQVASADVRPGVNVVEQSDRQGPTDQMWRKTNIVFGLAKDITRGARQLANAKPVEQAVNQLIRNEIRTVAVDMQDCAKELAMEQRSESVEATVIDLRWRVSVLLVSVLTAHRVKDPWAELANMGFNLHGSRSAFGRPVIVVFLGLFLMLIILHEILGTTRVIAQSPIIPGDILHRLIQVSLLVVSVASSVYVALTLRRTFIDRKTWASHAGKTGSIVSYTTIGIASFITSAILLFILNIPSTNVLVAIEGMIHLVIIYSFAPAAAGILICVWLDHMARGERSDLWHMVITAGLLGAISGLAALIFVSDPRKQIPSADANLFIVLSAAQYLISGVVVAMLARVLHNAEEVISQTQQHAASATVTEFPSNKKSA